jgi:hypothetical protein
MAAAAGGIVLRRQLAWLFAVPLVVGGLLLFLWPS